MSGEGATQIESIKLPRPAKQQRDALRRNQIVAAAQHCVVKHGFHAASMAQIAERARMSVGQIYRYFPSKEAIVHAIVERIVVKRLQWIDSSSEHEDLAQLITALLFDDNEKHDRVLLLEATVEATRNPAVAAIMRVAHRRLQLKAITELRRNYPHLSEREAAVRVEFIAMLSEGTASRHLTERSGQTDALRALYHQVISSLLQGRG